MGPRGVAVLQAQPRLSCAIDPAPSNMPNSVDPGSYYSPDAQRPTVPLPIEKGPRLHDPYSAFRFGDFALFTAGNFLLVTRRLMLAGGGGGGGFSRTPPPAPLRAVWLWVPPPPGPPFLPAAPFVAQ